MFNQILYFFKLKDEMTNDAIQHYAIPNNGKKTQYL